MKSKVEVLPAVLTCGVSVYPTPEVMEVVAEIEELCARAPYQSGREGDA